MTIPRAAAVAVRLNNGNVLVTGGWTTGNVIQYSTDIYNPSTNTWSVGPDMNLARGYHTATLLAGNFTS